MKSRCAVMLFLVSMSTAELALGFYTEPMAVQTKVDGLHGLPGMDYPNMYIFLMGKDTDVAGLEWEYSNRVHWVIHRDNDWAGNYSGGTPYLTLTFHSNGLGGIGSYPENQITYDIDGHLFTVSIPAFTFTRGGEYFSLYIAANGAAFYGRPDHLPALWGTSDSPLTMSPSEAFAAEHLAAGIPEPATLMLMSMGAIFVARVRKAKP